MTVQQTGVNERLASLTKAGTSIWLDQIRRNLIESGELERLVREDSLRGVTSNPSIFEKAILGSDDYDADIKQFAEEGPDRTIATATSKWIRKRRTRRIKSGCN